MMTYSRRQIESAYLSGQLDERHQRVGLILAEMLLHDLHKIDVEVMAEGDAALIEDLLSLSSQAQMQP